MLFSDYKNLPKWKGKIFMQDEETCYNDGWQNGYATGLLEGDKHIEGLQKRIHILEVYLEGTANFLILEGDSNNPIIRSVERILHTTLNKSPKGSTVYQNLIKAKEVITGLLNCFPYDMANEELDVGQIDIVEKAEKFLKETEK